MLPRIAGFFFSSLTFFINVSSQETAGHPVTIWATNECKMHAFFSAELIQLCANTTVVQTQLSCRLTIYLAGITFKTSAVTRPQ